MGISGNRRNPFRPQRLLLRMLLVRMPVVLRRLFGDVACVGDDVPLRQAVGS